MELKNVYSVKSYGRYGFELEIKAATRPDIDFDCDAIREAAYNAQRMLQEAILGEVIKHDVETSR